MASSDWRITDAPQAQLQALFDLAEVASFAQDSAEIYDAAIRALVRATSADRAGVLTFDADGVIRFKDIARPVARVPRGGGGALAVGARRDRRAAGAGAGRGGRCRADEFRELFVAEGVGALAFIPLLGKSGVIGKFMLYYNAPHEFRDVEVRIAQTIATHVTFAAERRRAELELRDSEERFRAAFLQSAVGMSETTLAGQFRIANERCCQILGYTQKELRERTFLEIAHPADRAACARATDALLAGETQSYSMESRLVRGDGATIWVLLYVSLVRDRANAPNYLLCAMQDITGRIRAEQALSEKRRQLALARSAARLGIWECDLRRDEITLSGELAALCGLPPGRAPMAREEWLARIHPDDREHVQSLIRESLEKTHRWDAEVRVVWPDGTIRWLLGKATVFSTTRAGRSARRAYISTSPSGKRPKVRCGRARSGSA